MTVCNNETRYDKRGYMYIMMQKRHYLLSMRTVQSWSSLIEMSCCVVYIIMILSYETCMNNNDKITIQIIIININIWYSNIQVNCMA